MVRKDGPIIIIDDDADDREILKEILEGLRYPNEIICFTDGYSALDYLAGESVNPFIIFSDVNMPKMSGYQFRDYILADENLRRKCVPFIFITTSASDATIARAYEQSAHGFFHKLNDYLKFQQAMENIVKYWLTADAPVFPNPLVSF